MEAVIIVIIAICISFMAFFIRDRPTAMVIHMVSVMAWLVSGYFVFNYLVANPIPNNTYIPTAGALVCFAMVLAHIAGFIIKMMSTRPLPPHQITYEEDQQTLKRNVYRRTKRYDRSGW